MNFKKILIAVNDDPSSEECAKTGLELAKKLNAEIAMIYVNEIAVYMTAPDGVGIPPLEMVADINKSALQTMKRLSNNEQVSYFHPEGDPKEEILTKADSWGADIIVMGTHGRKGFSHLIIGSVAERVIRFSHIPVLVVPMEKQ